MSWGTCVVPMVRAPTHKEERLFGQVAPALVSRFTSVNLRVFRKKLCLYVISSVAEVLVNYFDISRMVVKRVPRSSFSNF